MSKRPENYWINEEMSGLELPDKRLEERLRKILYDFSQHPTGVEREMIVVAQHQATLARIEAGAYPCLLSVQDTTKYNFNHHPSTTGLGPLDNANVQDFFAHSSLAVRGAVGLVGPSGVGARRNRG